MKGVDVTAGNLAHLRCMEARIVQEPRPEHNFVIETWGSLPLSLLSHDAGATRWSSVLVEEREAESALRKW